MSICAVARNRLLIDSLICVVSFEYAIALDDVSG